MASTNFINECEKRVNGNRLGKINVANEITLKGNNIEIENSTIGKIASIKLAGKSTQAVSTDPISPSPDYPSEIESIKGKNLWKPIATATKSGMTFTNNGDGSYTLNGTATANTSFYITDLNYIVGTYTLSANNSITNSNGAFYMKAECSGGSISLPFTSLNAKTTKTTTEPITACLVVIPNGITLTNFTFRPQLEAGSTATEFVPYNCIEFKSTGKNLFDKDNANILNAFINGGTKTIQVFDTARVLYIPIKSNTIYTIQKKIGTRFSVGTSQDISLGTICTNVVQKNSNLNITITSGDNDKYLVVWYYYYNGEETYTEQEILDSIMIEQGSTATEYEPYQSSSTIVDLKGNELCSIGDVKDELVVKDGKASITKKIGKVVLDGSEVWGVDTGGYVRFYKSFNVAITTSGRHEILSNYFKFSNNSNEVGIGFVSSGVLFLYPKRNINTVDNFKSWLKSQYDSGTPVKVQYQLSEPYEIDLGSVDTLNTFEGTTYISNSEDAGMEVESYNWGISITNSDNLQSFEIDSGCYVDGNIIGSVYAKCLKANFIADNNNLVDKSIQAHIGVKYANLSNEYINMGKYTVERPNNEITTNYSQITAYDDLYTNLDKKYVCNIDYSSDDKTVSDLYIDVCNQLGLIPKTTTFINSTIPITANPFTNGENNRTVLQTVAKIACSFVDIDNDTNKIDLCWLSDNEAPDYIFKFNDGEKAQYAVVDGGQVVCGPINCLIIKNIQIDDENITIKDDESIAENGEHSITISEDYILYNADLRQQAITAIWNRVKGMKYVDCKLTTYYGKPFLKLGDKIRIYTSDTEYFDTYVLKHNFKYDGAFTSVIESPALTEQEIKTKQDVGLKEILRNTQIEVNKQKGEIKAVTKTTSEISENLDNNYYTKTNINELVQTSESGITNTFSEAGGNNIFRNTGLWFADDKDNTYEYWQGEVIKNTNDSASSNSSMLLLNGSLSQEQEVPNGNYSISFYYQKLIELANASVVINEIEYQLDSTEVKQFYTGEQDSETKEYIVQPIIVTNGHIKIEFKCDTNNGVEVYDLMCNKGSVKLAYSQNQNETTTDTVNISKGITITSSVDENVKFKANYDGIRVLDGNNNVKTKFTDKGMETDEAKITEKAEITGLLFQEVDEQSWITKM